MVDGRLIDAVALGAAAFIASAGACALAAHWLARLNVLDIPNHRSSHGHRIARGGGVGFIAVILLFWSGLGIVAGSATVTVAVLLGSLAVAAISFADDLGGVSAVKRLLVQIVAVFFALVFFPANGPIVAAFLPIEVDRFIAGLLWLWFINLFNFMDGIDGLAAGEAGVIAFGIVLLAAFHPDLGLPAIEAVVVGASALAFLIFNWSPARVFMGDVGSTGLGFLLGWLLLITAARGGIAAAILLPLYFLTDATTTLIYRAWRGRYVGEAHRDHAYQRGVDGGLTHSAVTARILLLGIFLTGAALVALQAPVSGLVLGLALTLALLVWLRRRPLRP